MRSWRLVWLVCLAAMLSPADAMAQRSGRRAKAANKTTSKSVAKQRQKGAPATASPKSAAPSSTAADEAPQWIGVQVMPRTATASFGDQARATGRASDVTPWPQMVHKFSGGWLWIEAPLTQGWIRVADVVPLADSIQYFNERLARKQSTWDLYMRGSALRAQERFAETYKDFRALDLLEEKQVRALIAQANKQLNKSDYRGVIATASQMARMHPDNPTIYSTRGEAYRMLGDVARAKADFDKGVELAASTQTYAARATFYREQGDLPRAIADLDKAIYHWPLVRLYEARAMCRAEQQDFAGAIDDLNVSLSHNPKNAESYVKRGYVRLASGKEDEANADFAAAIRAAPKAETYQRIAESRFCCKQYGEAIEESDAAIRLDPKLTSAYLVRGKAQANLGQDAKALADFQQALRIRPSGDSDGHLQRAWLRWKRGEIEQSLADANAAAQLGNRSESCLLLQAAGTLAKGDTTGAIARLDASLLRYPALREAYTLRSVAHWIAGDDLRAGADWQVSRELQRRAWLPELSTQKPITELIECPVGERQAVFLSGLRAQAPSVKLASRYWDKWRQPPVAVRILQPRVAR